MEEVFSRIVEEWFLTEPLLFAAYCTHSLEENRRIGVPMRTGKMHIEYNPDMMQDWTPAMIAERLRVEVIRILLGHPYQRQPYKAKKAPLGIASDVTIESVYGRSPVISIPEGLTYEKGKCFEEYYAEISAFLEKAQKDAESPQYEIEGFLDDGGGGASDDAQQSSNSQDDAPSNNDDGNGGPVEDGDDGDGDSAEDNEDEGLSDAMNDAAEMAELWEEDQLAAEQLKELVRRTKRSHQWGSITGGLKSEIEATTIVRIDYRTILSGFRATVLSSRRHLTRMIPSRRYGFQYMGSKRDFATRLLVAIDVSGSVKDEQVAQALSIINRFFKYGVENIDVILFDIGIKGEPMSMKKAMNTIAIEGRGGTEFQSAIDYFLMEHYDGLIMITDGYAEVPEVPHRFYGNILWMLYNDTYSSNSGNELSEELKWIETFPKSRYTILPPVA